MMRQNNRSSPPPAVDSPAGHPSLWSHLRAYAPSNTLHQRNALLAPPISYYGDAVHGDIGGVFPGGRGAASLAVPR